MKIIQLDSNEELGKSVLDPLGVYHSWFDPASYSTNSTFSELVTKGNYNYSDIITISPTHLADYDAKIDMFFKEHIHKDDEVRYFLEGSGYFDVRDASDRWIRLVGTPGDFIVLPAGIYHRFAPDDTKYAKVMRLFVGEPVWTSYNRGTETDQLSSRLQYITKHSIKTEKVIKLTISEPSNFLPVLSHLSSTASPIFLLFLASNDPQTNQPWCPDVRKANPLISEVLDEISPPSPIYFIDIPLEKDPYKKPDFYYRTLEGVNLTKIPTLALWKDGQILKRLVEGELHEINNIRSFINQS